MRILGVFYRYCFMRIYAWRGDDADGSRVRALAFLSLLVGLNLLSAMSVSEHLAGRRLFPAIEPSGTYGLAVFVALYLLHYLALGRGEHPNEIAEEFRGYESPAMAFAYYLYCGGSLLFFFGWQWFLSRQ